MSLYFKFLEKFYPPGDKLPAYTPQFRLEVRARDVNSVDALAMRTADPLWMLGRQWQFGEFQGEDNGSPIQAKAFYRKEKTQYTSTTKGGTQRKKINNIPIEALVEAVDIPPLDLKSKVRIGQQFERLIRAHFSKTKATHFIKALRGIFPLKNEVWKKHDLQNDKKLDHDSERFFNLMQHKVIDGSRLLENIKNQAYPYQSQTENFKELMYMTYKIKGWHNQFFVKETKGLKSWDAYKLSYKFNVHLEEKSNSNDATLHAPEYQSGHLDWYSFDSAKVKLDPSQELASTPDEIPINVTFEGMPDKRLFSFEDSKADLSSMDIDTSDLLKLMVLDFTLVSGSDWYTIPLDMELGELCWIDRVEVKDVFGVTTIIQNDTNKGAVLDENPLKVWDAFKIRNRNIERYQPKDHFLYLPPASTFKIESEPIEELLFLRDEYANMVWAVEKIIPNAMGNPMEGFDLHLELYGSSESEENSTDEIPRYRLSSIVPTNWIPYVPRQVKGSLSEIELKRAYMMRNHDDELPTDIRPLTRLAENDVTTVREEAIPKAGVRVQMTKQRIRWTDGKTYVWMGRKILTGRGEGNSGLRFDFLT